MATGRAEADLPLLVKQYIRRMLSETGQGMKAMILDSYTMGIVSCVFSQTEILQKDVVLIEKLDSEVGEPMLHLKAVCFMRPSPQNITGLKRHFKTPKFGEYHLFFTNVLRDSLLQDIADADDGEIVKQVQEYFADYLALDSMFFSLQIENHNRCFMPQTWESQVTREVYERTVEGVASALLTFKKRPVIRYSQNSETARRIAQDVRRLAYEQEAALFDFRRAEGPMLLLVLDRIDDPVTPLLTQWTYQAMVHELLTISKNIVDLKHCKNINEENKELVLSSGQDTFFREHMFANFGDLGAAVKKMVDDFQVKSKSNQNIQSIEDMKRVLENYPEFRHVSLTVGKHVTIMGELSRVIDERRLMKVSQVEQDLASQGDRSLAFSMVQELLEDPSVKEYDKIRLVMLFALRYEREGMPQVDQLLNLFPSSEAQRLVKTLLSIAGLAKRSGDVYGEKNLLSRAQKMVGGLKGVDNVYTQHQPLLQTTLDNILKGKLKDTDYPYAGPSLGPKDRPQDIMIFIVGGATYEESKVVQMLNVQAKREGSNSRYILGGTSVMNSKTFVDVLRQMSDADDLL